MKTKMFAMLFALVVLCSGIASAVNLEITELYVDKIAVDITSTPLSIEGFDRGEQLPIEVCVKALADVKNAQISAFIPGTDYANEENDQIFDMTDTFDLNSGVHKCYKLDLQVPIDADRDTFTVKIEANDRRSTTELVEFDLAVQGVSKKQGIKIVDYSLDPQEVIAGRAFTGKVKVQNLYYNDITDLKVTMSIPELNIKVSEYMDEIGPDKSRTFEELLLRVPECAKAGTYNVEIKVEFAKYSKTQSIGTIDVVSSNTCGQGSGSNVEGNTIISIPNMQEVAQGTSVVYPIVINNAGKNAQTYALSVTGASTWATTRIDPSSVVVVPAGQSKTAYLYVSTNENAEVGDKAFTLTIDSGSDTKNVPLVAKVTKSTASDWSVFKNALQISLVVLVVILIIVGLIIGFNKMKENKQESEPYY